MGKTHIEKTLNKYREIAAKKGAILNVTESDFIDDDHLDCVWYGGNIGNVVYKGVIFDISVHGDVCLYGSYKGQEIYYKNKSNSGAIGTDLYYQIPDDKTLHQLSRFDLQEKTKDYLEYGNNNWVEFFFGDSGSSDVANEDNVLEAVGEALEAIEDLFRCYEEATSLCCTTVEKVASDSDSKSKTFRFTYSVEGYVDIEVSAETEEEAEKIALEKASEVDCGKLYGIDWNRILVEVADE